MGRTLVLRYEMLRMINKGHQKHFKNSYNLDWLRLLFMYNI